MTRDYESGIERLQERISRKEQELGRLREDLKCLKEEYVRVKNKELMDFMEARHLSAPEAINILNKALEENG